MLILASTITDCVSISAFASFVVVPIDIRSSAVGTKIVAITSVIKTYKPVIKKKKKKHDKSVLLGKSKLSTINILISKPLFHSYISQDEFVSVKNVLGEYYEMKEQIKIPETFVEYIISKQ